MLWSQLAQEKGESPHSLTLAQKLDAESETFREEFLIPSIGTVIDPSFKKSTFSLPYSPTH